MNKKQDYTEVTPVPDVLVISIDFIVNNPVCLQRDLVDVINTAIDELRTIGGAEVVESKWIAEDIEEAMKILRNRKIKNTDFLT